jgi:hypothetical protein
MSDEAQDHLAEISKKLDTLIALTASAGRDADAQIDLLTSLGYSSSFVGRIVGIDPAAVRMRLSRKKRGTKGRSKAARK